MYNLPSEDPEEPGLPDEFHDLQPQLLTLTCRSRCYPPSQMFTETENIRELSDRGCAGMTLRATGC